MTDFSMQDLLAMIGAKQIQIDTLQAQLGQVVEKYRNTVECPDPTAHAVPAEEEKA